MALQFFAQEYEQMVLNKRPHGNSDGEDEEEGYGDDGEDYAPAKKRVRNAGAAPHADVPAQQHSQQAQQQPPLQAHQPQQQQQEAPPPHGLSKRRYYCRYCKQSWPLTHFRNSQQFGAHCSNCSRRPRNNSPSSPSSPAGDIFSPTLSSILSSPVGMLAAHPITWPPMMSQIDQQHAPASDPAEYHEPSEEEEARDEDDACEVLATLKASPTSRTMEAPRGGMVPDVLQRIPSQTALPLPTAAPQHHKPHALHASAAANPAARLEDTWRTLCRELDVLHAVVAQAAATSGPTDPVVAARCDVLVNEFSSREQKARKAVRALVSQAASVLSARGQFQHQQQPLPKVAPKWQASLV